MSIPASSLSRRAALMTLPLLLGGARIATGSTNTPNDKAVASESKDVALPSRTLGSPDAPLKMIEFFSLTCPHCAHFHLEVFPRIHKDWIQTEKLQWEMWHFPLDNTALRAAALAECFSGDSFFAFVELLLEQQKKWAPKPQEALPLLALQTGMTNDQANACMNDKNTLRRVVAQAREAQKKWEIRKTPSLLLQDQLLAETNLDFVEQSLRDMWEKVRKN